MHSQPGAEFMRSRERSLTIEQIPVRRFGLVGCLMRIRIGRQNDIHPDLVRTVEAVIGMWGGLFW